MNTEHDHNEEETQQRAALDSSEAIRRAALAALDLSQFSATNNGERAQRGAALVQQYAKKMDFSGGDLNESYSHADPICDILHAAHKSGMEIELILWSALNNFVAETGVEK